MESKHDLFERRKEWRSLLKAENCVEIKKMLLSDNGHDLLPVGWYKVDAAADAAPLWRGRTALHVAARKGDVELVEIILNIAYDPLASASVASQGHGSEGSTDVNPDLQNHLLEVIHSDYQLNALGMAVVNGNKHIVNLLKGASWRCGWNPYNISHDRVKDEDMNSKLSDADEDIKRKATLSDVTEAALLEVTQSDNWNKEDTIETMKTWYRKDCDFNFIDIDRDMHLFFHSTFSAMSQVEGRENLMKREKIMKRIRTAIITRASEMDGDSEFLLATLKDGQGRTALHVAVDNCKVREFLDTINSLPVKVDKGKILNARDSLSRTPLYRAAARSILPAMKGLLGDTTTDINAIIEYDTKTWEAFGIDIDKVSWENGFRSGCVFVPQKQLDRRGFNSENASPGDRVISNLDTISCTALHVAIIHQNERVVKDILQALKERHDANESPMASSPNCIRRFCWPVVKALQGEKAIYPTREATTMNLSVLVGNVTIVRSLLEAEETWAAGTEYSFDKHVNFPTFLLAAAMGNPAVVKAFLDKGELINFLECDGLGNTALHHALSGIPIELRPHLLDFVGCHHVYSWRWNNDDCVSQWLANPLMKETQVDGNEEKPTLQDVEDRSEAQRQGTIELLLEAGIDMWAKNIDGRTACPDPGADKDFAEWWYDKVADETSEEQTTLNDAANAISVVAALVATASYVGPATPPLGYSDDDALRLNILAVRIFVVCDSLSFYFALAAIMLSLLPALPLKNPSMFAELKRRRRLVAGAVSFLFPSIIMVLMAFATGYIAASPDHGLTHHGLVVATTVVGAFCCFVVIIMFFRRWVAVIGDQFKGVGGEAIEKSKQLGRRTRQVKKI